MPNTISVYSVGIGLSQIGLTLLSLLLFLPSAQSVETAPEAPSVINTPAPPRLDFDLEERLKPGLLLEFFDVASENGMVIDARPARLTAIFVPGEQSPTPFLAAGPFKCRLRGFLFLEMSGKYTLSLAGRGTVTVRVNGTTVFQGSRELSETPSATVELYRDFNPIEITYESPQTGTAELRLEWEGRRAHFDQENAFGREPVPPAALRYDPQDPALAGPRRQRHGRQTLARMNCLNCHDLPSLVSNTGAVQMPELSHQNPRLDNVGDRLRADWIYHWIADPAQMRNHTRMPAVFAHDENAHAKAEILNLVAYLTSLSNNHDTTSASDDAGTPDLARQGELLFENLGCIACHRFTPSDAEDYYGRTTLYTANAKYKPGTLIKFLQAPAVHYPSSRMPDFRLTDHEAQTLAAFVRQQSSWQPPQTVDVSAGDIEQGRLAFQAHGCAACHQVAGHEDVAIRRVEIAATVTESGCLATKTADRGNAPMFDLQESDREALTEFLARPQQAADSLNRYVPAEAAERTIAEYRCIACHGRDGEYSLLSEVVLEEGVQGLPPGNIPDLTWAGEKLQRDWLGRLLTGKLEYRARPWLKARMPGFTAAAKPVAAGLALQHGYSGKLRPRPSADAQLVPVGKKLTQQHTGFFCTECHSTDGTPSKSAFDHRGIDFPYVTERLQYDYYHRWMRDPQRIDPTTKMPQFAKRPVPDVLDGDAQRQFDAIWHYLQSLEKTTP